VPETVGPVTFNNRTVPPADRAATIGYSLGQRTPGASGSAFAATAGAAYVLDAANGMDQVITLSGSLSAVTLGNFIGGARLRVRVISTPPAFILWPANVVWRPGNQVPGLTGDDTFELWSPDGVTVIATGGTQAFPGIDPVTIPGVTDVMEAWSLPFADGETIPTSGTPIPARLGTNMAAIGTVLFQQGLRPAKLTRALTYPGDVRPYIDCGATGASITLTRALGGNGNPFTLFLGCVMPADTFNGTYFGDINGTGRRYSLTNAGTSISSELGGDANYSNWTQVGPPSAPLLYDDGTPLVITVSYNGATSGEPYSLRVNGVATARTNGAAATSNAPITGLEFSGAAPSGWADGLLHISSVVLASATLLDSSTPRSPVQLIERWLAYSMGLTL
jgi:hypothetical protein